MSDTPEQSEIPKKIGKYEILEKIGEGGFGIVYKGRDPFIKRHVAVKTCSSDNESIQQRFFREAEIAGNLHHANVVTIHDFGVEGETPYLVQEFLTGEDLDVLVREKPESIPLESKIQHLRGIAEGLRYAHSQGVIHRDIKPANIRILENGKVKVMDFGIAKLKDQESQLTQTGMTLGTVSYLSPEQLKGDQIDHRADIFSYGVLAYELLTGQRPFAATSIQTLFYQLLHEDPQPISVEGLPDGLQQLVLRCLAKERDDRFQNFDEVIAELERIQAAAGIETEDDDLFGSPGGASVNTFADRARQALASGDLTSAELTISRARRQFDASTFERNFKPLLSELEVAKQAAAQPLPVPGTAGGAVATGPAVPPPQPPAPPPQPSPVPAHTSEAYASASSSAGLSPMIKIAAAVVAVLVAGVLGIMFLGGGDDPGDVTPTPTPSVTVVSAGSTGNDADMDSDPGSGGANGSDNGGTNTDDDRSGDIDRQAIPTPGPQDEQVDTPVTPEPTPTPRPTRRPTRRATPAPTPAPTRTPPPPTPTPRATATPTPTPDAFDPELIRAQNGVSLALRTFESAWKSLDYRAINAIHVQEPSLSRRDVRPYRTANVVIGACDIQVDGSTAVASCPIRVDLELKSGGNDTRQYSRATMQRQGARWIITDLR